MDKARFILDYPAGRMMRWPWQTKTEERSYSAAIEAALLAAATGGTATPSRLACVQAAAGLLGRTMAGSVVSPTGPRTAAVTPAWLYSVGHRLMAHGRATDYLRLGDGGSVQLHPVSAAELVAAPFERASWRYKLRFKRPSGDLNITAGGDSVFDLETRACTTDTATLAANLEQTLAQLCGGPHGTLWPLPAAAGDVDGETDRAAYVALAADVKRLKGGLAIMESARSGHDLAGAGGASTEAPIKLHGPEPVEALVQLRTDAEASVLAALGVPPALVGLGPAGQADRRELMRAWQVAFVRPMLTLAAAELSRVLGASVSFAPSMMTPADLVSLTRAARSLIQSGVVAADALRVVGLPADVELAPPTPAPTPGTT